MIIDEHTQNSIEVGMKSIESATDQDAHYESPEALESKQERMARKFGLGLDDIARGQNLSSQSAVPSTLHHSLYADWSSRDCTSPVKSMPSERTRTHSRKLWELTKVAENRALSDPVCSSRPMTERHGSVRSLSSANSSATDSSILSQSPARPMTERQGSVTSLSSAKSSATDSSILSQSTPSYFDSCIDPNGRFSKSGRSRRKDGSKDMSSPMTHTFKVSWDKFPTDVPKANIKPTMSTEHFLDGIEFIMKPTKDKPNIRDLMRRDLSR